jgi:hypothetical protein
MNMRLRRAGVTSMEPEHPEHDGRCAQRVFQEQQTSGKGPVALM